MDILRSLDWNVLNALATYTSTHVWVALVVSLAAELLIAVPIVSLYALWRLPQPISQKHSNQKAALLASMALLMALALKALINFLISRPRPFVSHPDLLHLPLKVDPASFPSGHTVIVFAIAFSIYFSGLHKLGGWLLGLATVVAISRVMAGVHYPSDVIAGVLVAYGSAWYLHREASSIRRYLPND